MSATPSIGWFAIFRLGLVQTALGAIVILTTSTLNRVMVVELALPAVIPGALVALHYGPQLLRPRFGHGSDIARRRTPWIVGGMAVLAVGGFLAALATALAESDRTAGLALAVLAYLLIGIGAGSAGVSLLATLASHVAPPRRPAAATIVWLMMIAGFVATAATAGHFLEPYSSARLVEVAAAVCAAAFLVASVAVIGVERETHASTEAAPRLAFRAAFAATWAQPEARRFTVFIFLSMLAYSFQDLILEPFAGSVFRMTPGESTSLSGLQNAGVFAGMLTMAAIGTVAARNRAALRSWTAIGCIGSALSLAGLAAAAAAGPGWPLRPSVFTLGFTNGIYAVAAIAWMMALAGADKQSRHGIRMGIWGAAQAMAYGAGGFLGTVAVDLLRLALGSVAPAYGIAFAAEAVLFVIAAGCALRLQGMRHEYTQALSIKPAE